MIKYYLSLLITVLISISLLAQKEEREANYHFKSGNYAVSLKQYEKLYNKDTTNKEYCYRLGVSYLKCNSNPTFALKYFKIVETDKKTEPEFLFDIGKAYLYNHDFKNAKIKFDACKILAIKNLALKQEAITWYEMTKNAQKMVNMPLDVSFINMGKYINSEMDELTPFVTPDNEILLYTSNNKYDHKYLIYTYNVYYSNKKGYFKKGRLLSAVNSMDDEFMAGVSLTNERIYVQLQGYDGFQDLIYSDRNGKGYQGKTGLSNNINTKYAEFGACETVNGDTLFFSSGREGGFGGMDLYFSLKLPTGEWSVPRNLGDKINTPYDEDFPVLSYSGNIMYFTSNRPQSMGGFDLFKSKIDGASRKFSQPKNLGYPINDVYDNKTIAFSDNNRYAYVSAIKPNGFGYADLYRVIFNQNDPSVKIMILNFKKLEGNNKELFAATDTSLKITAFKKGKIVFGEYAYNFNSSSSTIALPPGDYSLEIVGIKTKEFTYKVSVPDIPSGKKIEKKEIVLELKN